ncbi:hypothetical protein B0A49_07711 [Cryomyces minteri]|uniref:Glucose-methanol-choline oxidoreductase N-terminal domain-containing protein n=1 Tax=Cryomyces minteri TaxID=331657 RepID=A0A4V5NG39_9PEZI|nr:hypothetical protein B0A49_07711 [Cryomyces minteri]
MNLKNGTQTTIVEGFVLDYVNGTLSTSILDPNGLLVLPNRNELYAGDGNGVIKVIDLFTNKIVANNTTSSKERAHEFAYDPASGTVVVTNAAETPSNVTVINANTCSVVGNTKFLAPPSSSSQVQSFYLHILRLCPKHHGLRRQCECTDNRPSRRSARACYIEELENKVKELEALIGDFAGTHNHGDGEQNHTLDEIEGTGRQSQGVTAPPSGGRSPQSTDSNARLPAAGEELLETMIPVADHGLEGDTSEYRGRFAGLGLLQRMRNLCSRLAGKAMNRPADPSHDDLFRAFDTTSTLPSSIHSSDCFAMLPTKELVIRRVRIAFDQAFCLMQFLDAVTVEVHINRIYETEPEDYTKDDRKLLALLYALLALGTRFMKNSFENGQEDNMKTSSKGLSYFRTSRKLMDIAECHDLISIQTVMCIVLYLQSIARMSASYSYICMAVAASLRMGLHTPAASKGLNLAERETRRRTFLVLNTMDTYVTTALGLPKTLREIESDRPLPTPFETDSRPTDVDDLFSTVAATEAHAELISIVARAVASIHPTHRPDYGDNGFYQVKHCQIADIEIELDNWFHNLPHVPDVDQPEEGNFTRSVTIVPMPSIVLTVASRNQLLLRLAYGHVQMVLYRPFLHHVVRDVPGSVFHYRSYACGSACVKAAMQVIWVAEALDHRGYLHEAYWFTVLILSAAITSLLVFILGNKGDPTTKESAKAVANAKGILARLAEQSPTAKQCLSSLKELGEITERSNEDLAADHADGTSWSGHFGIGYEVGAQFPNTWNERPVEDPHDAPPFAQLYGRDAAPSYSENLYATQLIGSHFGVPDTPASYDYVVVGGGTAGLVMARRLAANSSFTVAVIEAGGFYELDNGNDSEIPAFASQFTQPSAGSLKNALIDWYLHTTPQPGLGGRAPLYTSGRTFGGGSARNFLNYQRSSAGAFQKWADEVGDQSYTFSSLLPFFERSVNFHPPDASTAFPNVSFPYNASYFSQTGGPLQVSFPGYFNAISSWLGKFEELGFSRLPGFSDGRLFGWSYFTYTVDPTSQTRSSSATSFLREALRQTTNLNFYKSTQVKKILFSDCKNATGVLVNTAGVEYIISATKEVIVSAGAFYSPQLLMASGIGPAPTLSAHRIHLCVDRPGVGQNMWDNIFSGPTYPVNVVTHNSLANPAVIGAAIGEYNSKRTGLLTNGGGDFLAFEKLPNESLSMSTRQALNDAYGTDWPDVEYLELDAYFGNQLLPPPADTIGKNVAALLPGLTAPFSRGNVTIASNDTSVLPVVSPNWLTDPRDREVLIAAFRRARQVWATKSIQGVITGPEAYPGANVTSDSDLLAAIRQSAQTIWHASATNKMGMVNDSMAVVDSRARVIGVNKLRVVNASAFPFLPPGQPQSMVYALAEKIAQHILDGE